MLLREGISEENDKALIGTVMRRLQLTLLGMELEGGREGELSRQPISDERHAQWPTQPCATPIDRSTRMGPG